MKLFNTESTHWYTRKGEPMHSVIGSNGQERPTTLREARKLSLLPSVTNVLGVINKPELASWKMEQAVLAALTLPRLENESVDDFAKRVAADSESRVRSATGFGTDFHAGAERVAQNPMILQPSEPLFPYLVHYQDWFTANCERLLWTERVLVSSCHGYAGTADLLMIHKRHGLCLVDIKTQGVKPGNRLRAYQSWAYQLAAYGQVVAEPLTALNLMVNSTEPQPVEEHVWTRKELASGWGVFLAANAIWQTEKDYYPLCEPVPARDLLYAA